MGLEIKNHLQWRLGLVLSSTTVWNHPTVSALTTHLANKLNNSPGSITTTTSGENFLEEENHLTTVEQLSEDEATSLLARTLAKIEENMRDE